MGFQSGADFCESFNGEEELLEELYRQMLRVVRHKLWRKGDSSDIVQEAWVRILENYPTLREKDKLVPWAKTIASNLASNANRKKKLVFECELDERRAAVHEPILESDLTMELSELLGLLSPRARTLLLYKFYYGFKDAEIAEALSLPIGTVKAQIHRSKLRLSKLELGRSNSSES
ncbi:MAG: sigma-70 family RNA polymerase sigma factor [Candidatus Cohnella colombiensis]|uniref:Sigma-70 family RNA polymerase sigma factor n=1 Tax=Candidatus Cohnella colombiensis TaxID=3121368 RepID=A0AA95EYH2_9BACL|nr:MAG: sigma-70 family RNA polymerase sigma factor [Cohnella sp.]